MTPAKAHYRLDRDVESRLETEMREGLERALEQMKTGRSDAFAVKLTPSMTATLDALEASIRAGIEREQALQREHDRLACEVVPELLGELDCLRQERERNRSLIDALVTGTYAVRLPDAVIRMGMEGERE